LCLPASAVTWFAYNLEDTSRSIRITKMKALEERLAMVVSARATPVAELAELQKLKAMLARQQNQTCERLAA
jgi:hypothetical protein